MSKHILASCFLATALWAGSAQAAEAPKCSDPEVERSLASLIVSTGLGKVYATADGGFVTTASTGTGITYKYMIEKQHLGGVIDFKFDAERERRVDASIGKRYCTASLTGNLNREGLRHAIRFGKGQAVGEEPRPLTPDQTSEALAKAEKNVSMFVRWTNPLNYSVQTLEKGGAIVTMNE